MKVFLLKDVAGVGRAGTIITVAQGFAVNFLLPSKAAVQVNGGNEAEFARRAARMQVQKEEVVVKTSLLAERIKVLRPTIRVKMHDDSKLYGAVSALDIVNLLAGEGIRVSKNQILFEKVIKTKGLHAVTVKLSNALQPSFTLKVAAE